MMILVPFLLFSCKKDEDQNGPSIEIIFPNNGASFMVPTEVPVRVRVSDDREVTTVRFDLYNSDGIPVTNGRTATVEAPSAEVERSLDLTDERLLSGAITLAVRASDGVQETTEHRSLQLQAAPLRLRALYATGVSGGQTIITRFDSLLAPSIWSTVAQDHSGAVISSNSGTLAIAGNVTGDLIGLNTSDATAQWTLNNPGTGQLPFFLWAGTTDQGRLLISTGDAFVRSMNFATGAQSYARGTLPGHLAGALEQVGTYLISDQWEIAGPMRRLVIYSFATGDLLTSYALDIEVVGFWALDEDRVLVFGNRNGDLVIAERNVELGGGWEPIDLSNSVLRDVVRTGPQSFVLATDQGTFRYTYPNNSLVPLDGSPSMVLAYHAASGAVFSAAGNTIRILDPILGSTLGTLNTSHPITSLCPLFNRDP
ncbi:MAG: hypothetical protein KDB88_10520 [Flavobacteriales bacterium]|nr:hypothetical protein [Flavobacteriales bacterium]